jgi:hypothetical protein
VTSFARTPFVVERIDAGNRPALVLRQRRRVAHRERVGQHAQADAAKKWRARPLRLRQPLVLAVWWTAGEHQRYQRLREEFPARLPFDQYRTGELFSDQ